MSASLVQSSSAMNMAEWETQGHHAPARNDGSAKQEDDSDDDDDDAPSNHWDRAGDTATEYGEYTTQPYCYNNVPTMMNTNETSERLMQYSVYQPTQPKREREDRKMPAEPRELYANDDDDRKQTSIASSPVQRGCVADGRSEHPATHGFGSSYDYDEAGPEQMMQPLPLHPNDRSWPLESQYDDQYGGTVYPPPPPQPSYPPPPQAPEYETQRMEPQPQYASSHYRASSAVARMHHPSVDHHRQQQQQRHPRPPTYHPPSRAPEHHHPPHIAAAGIHRNPSPIFMNAPPPEQPPPMRTERRTPRLANNQRVPSQEELSIASTPRAVQALQTWYVRFNELVQYRDEQGHCNVPQKYEVNAQLGIWVNKQRMEKKFMDEHKRTSMTEAKVRNLESIGFKWAKRKGQVSWNIKYAELTQFHAQQGHCDVPTKYKENQALGRWVSTQRSEYKKYLERRSKHMTKERIEKLSRLSFKWEMLNGPQRSSSDSDSD